MLAGQLELRWRPRSAAANSGAFMARALQVQNKNAVADLLGELSLPNETAHQLQALYRLPPTQFTIPYRGQRWCRPQGAPCRSA